VRYGLVPAFAQAALGICSRGSCGLKVPVEFSNAEAFVLFLASLYRPGSVQHLRRDDALAKREDHAARLAIGIGCGCRTPFSSRRRRSRSQPSQSQTYSPVQSLSGVDCGSRTRLSGWTAGNVRTRSRVSLEAMRVLMVRKMSPTGGVSAHEDLSALPGSPL
jgi:hypothetical protein